MTNRRHIRYSLLGLSLFTHLCFAQSIMPVDGINHVDPIELDQNLSLSQLVEQTLEKYPDRLINEALQNQADAWQTRGDGWFAGSQALALDYNSDKVADDRGSREISGQLEFTIWNWGQRSAAQEIAERSQQFAAKQSSAVRIEVAGLVRSALWEMALAESRVEIARYYLDISSQLLDKVKRRVDLGDLARADLLLAESEHLHNQSLLNQAVAELMHSRKNYSTLTQSNHVPVNYKETLSPLSKIEPNHPLLDAINTLVERKQASIEWAKTTDTINQPKLHFGGRTTRDHRAMDDIQTASVGVVIPFGHSSYDAPEVAASYAELNQVKAAREHLMRDLEKKLHEAEHMLDVTRQELAIAIRMKEIAETHLNMTQISFSSGEINLLDLLKIQARSLEAIRNAKEQEVKLQRYIALYNQAVGVMP
ncbi:MAG: TolC family protein [Methylococcaceae bacterium]|jgi:outer membrane protein TolC|nr:TolC family protein [Methylococcaceae bacterium]